MKTYSIGDSSTETIEFRTNEHQFALVHRIKSSQGDTYKTIIMNQREILNLYQAIQEQVLNKK